MSMAPLGPLPFIVGLWVLGATSFGKVAYLQYLSSRVDASRMGALQGALGAVSALSSIVGSNLFTTLFVGPLGGHNSWSLFLIGAGILCMACALIVPLWSFDARTIKASGNAQTQQELSSAQGGGQWEAEREDF